MSKMQSQTAQRHLFVLIDNKHACRSPNQTKRHDSDNLHGGWIAGWGWESANVTLALCAAIESTQDFYEQFLFFFPFFFLLMLLLSQNEKYRISYNFHKGYFLRRCADIGVWVEWSPSSDRIRNSKVVVGASVCGSLFYVLTWEYEINKFIYAFDADTSCVHADTRLKRKPEKNDRLSGFLNIFSFLVWLPEQC